MKYERQQPKIIQFDLKYNLNRRSISHPYFLQDIKSIFSQLMIDNFDCKALNGLHCICNKYNLEKKIVKEVQLQIIRLYNQKSSENLCLSMNVQTSIVFQSENILATDILSDLMLTLSNGRRSLFKGVTGSLQQFLSKEENLDTLVRLNVVFSLLDIIKKTNLKLEMTQCEPEPIYRTKIHINYEQMESSFDELLKFVDNLDNVNRQDVCTYAQWIFKQIFQHKFDHILLAKGMFTKILDIFKHYPEIIRKVFRQIAHSKDNIIILLEIQSATIFKFVKSMLPTTNIDIVQTLLQMIFIILHTKNKQYYSIIWQSEQIIDLLEQATLLTKDKVSVTAFKIYKMLIVNDSYSQFDHLLYKNNIACTLVKALIQKSRQQLPSNAKVVQQGIKLIYRIIKFQQDMAQSSHITNKFLTQNFIWNGLRLIIEQILHKYVKKSKASTIVILCQKLLRQERLDYINIYPLERKFEQISIK